MLRQCSNQPGGSLQFSTPFLAWCSGGGRFQRRGHAQRRPDSRSGHLSERQFHIVFGQYNPITNSVFYVADAAHEDTVNLSFAGVGGIPVAADMNSDGYHRPGRVRAADHGHHAADQQWYWLVSNAAANPNNLPQCRRR